MATVHMGRAQTPPPEGRWHAQRCWGAGDRERPGPHDQPQPSPGLDSLWGTQDLSPLTAHLLGASAHPTVCIRLLRRSGSGPAPPTRPLNSPNQWVARGHLAPFREGKRKNSSLPRTLSRGRGWWKPRAHVLTKWDTGPGDQSLWRAGVPTSIL